MGRTLRGKLARIAFHDQQPFGVKLGRVDRWVQLNGVEIDVVGYAHTLRLFVEWFRDADVAFALFQNGPRRVEEQVLDFVENWVAVFG